MSVGEVDPRLLREALFVTSMADGVAWGPAFQRMAVPQEIPLSSELGEFPEGFELGASASSLQVRHEWKYMRRDQKLFEGELAWPEDLTRPELTYAVWLFDAVDATWQSGCVRRRDYQALIDQLSRHAPQAGEASESLRRELSTNQCARLPKPVRLGYRSGWQSSGLSLEESLELKE